MAHIKVPHIKHIQFDVHRGKERVSARVFRSWKDPNSLEIIRMKKDKFGYLLISFLNLDLHFVDCTIKSYDCGQSKASLYSDLVTYCDAFTIYLPEEINTIVSEFCGECFTTITTIKRVREYIDFCNNKGLNYHTRFFDYLNSMEYFGFTADIPEVNSIQTTPSCIDSCAIATKEVCLHDIFNSFTQNNPALDISVYSVDPIAGRVGGIMLASLCEIERAGHVIRKCKNCGKYFIPANRSDTLYCDNPSPEVTALTCKEYGTQRLWYEKQKKDEIAILSRKIASAKGMLAKRNQDIPQYAASYEYFKEQRRIWIKNVNAGTKTRDEYKKWLLDMQRQKIIKEDVYGID